MDSDKQKPKSLNKFKINKEHRDKLTYFLKKFYEQYPNEKYTIFHFVKYFKQRLKSNKDAWCAVCGNTSVGKSLFVLMSMILFGRKMNLTDNVAYVPKGDEIVKMFDKLSFQTLLIDEAAREMRSVNWQSKAQQGVNIKAMTDRFKNNWVFLNMPNFNEFTKSMRIGNMQFRFIIPYRTDLYARVIVQRKSRNWRSDDPWNDNRANEVYEKVEKRFKDLSNDQILLIERNLDVTVMDFIVPNLEVILPDVTSEYDRLKAESRKETEVVDGVKRNIYRERYEALLNKVTKILFYNELGIGKFKVSKREMAEKLGVSTGTFTDYLKARSPDLVKKLNVRVGIKDGENKRF